MLPNMNSEPKHTLHTTYCPEHLELTLLALPLGSPEYIIPADPECDCYVCSWDQWEREEVKA